MYLFSLPYLTEINYIKRLKNNNTRINYYNYNEYIDFSKMFQGFKPWISKLYFEFKIIYVL